MVLALARWVHFSSLYILFGSSLFWIYMGPEAWDGTASRLPRTMARCGAIAIAAAPVVAISGFAWLLASIANMTGDFAGLTDPETLHAFFFETSFGPLAIVRVILFVALIASVVKAIEPRRRFFVLVALSGLLLVSQAWLGHAAEDGGTLYGASMIAAYIVHVIAGAAWLGGLVPLSLAVAEQSTGAAAAGPSRTPSIMARYSIMAIGAAAAVVISGMANTAFRIGVPSFAIVASPYATLLIAKAALVLALLGLAGRTRFRLMPQLEHERPEWLWISLIASIGAEAAIGVFVLGVAAVLGITPPPN